MGDTAVMTTISCTRIEGPCCDSCHDDADQGYDSLAVERYDPKTGQYVIVAYTCCLKREAVDAALGAEA